MCKEPFSGYIVNKGRYLEGEEIGRWLPFPTTDGKVRDVLLEIGVDGIRCKEVMITDYRSEIAGLTDCFGKYENLSMLNYLASLIQNCNRQVLVAALEHGEFTGSVEELINLVENLDCFYMIGAIRNDRDLGYFYAAEELGFAEVKQLMNGSICDLDFESYGRKMRLQDKGTYASDGSYIYLLDNPDLSSYKGTEDVPEEYRIYIRKILQCSEKACTCSNRMVSGRKGDLYTLLRSKTVKN